MQFELRVPDLLSEPWRLGRREHVALQAIVQSNLGAGTLTYWVMLAGEILAQVLEPARVDREGTKPPFEMTDDERRKLEAGVDALLDVLECALGGGKKNQPKS